MGVQSALSSWAACTSCGEWGDSLQQELAPPASAAHRQEPTAWSPSSQASDVTHKELEAKAQEEKLDLLKSTGGGCLKSIKACTDLFKGPIFLVFFKIINQGKTVRVSNSSKNKAELIRLNIGAAVTDCVKKECVSVH